MALMQWQHGTFVLASNGSLVLHPLEVDGRQLHSNPCRSATPDYTRYNVTEVFSKWEVVLDAYHGQYRLNLFQWDGTPANPMYLAYRPPEMLPTTVLNPVNTTGSNTKRKRDILLDSTRHASGKERSVMWIGLGLILCGGIAYAAS